MKAFSPARFALDRSGDPRFKLIGGAHRLLVGAAAAGVLALGLSACSEGDASEPTIQTATVVRQNMRITAEATGSVEPVRSVEVKSKASGEVLRLHADVGDYVEPGALLAEIDPRDVDNAYDQAVADLEVARARSDISKNQLDRSEQLLEQGIITQQEYESQRLDYANSQASLQKAETNEMLAELRKQDVTIRAPLAGTILTRNVEEGSVIQSASSNVSGGTALFVMANLQEVQIRTLVDETDMGQIKAGLPASVQVEAYPGRTFPGIVEKIEPQAVNQQNVTMFPVIVRLDNSSGFLKPGMNADVEMLLVERPDVIVVPNNAVVLPQEMAPAASVLGMNPETVTLDRTVYTQLAQAAGVSLGASEGAGRTRGGAAGGGRPSGGRGASAQGAPQARADGSEEAPQGRPRGAGADPAQGGEMGQTQAAIPDANPAMAGLLNTSGAPRAAITFVMLPDSTLEMRPVLMGVNDWDNAEILAGLEEGEQVALIGVAQLQAEQDAMRERMGGRGGMFPPGMGGMGRRGG